MVTCFLIPGKPQGKGRPRFNTTTKAVHTPDATRRYEQTVKYSYLSTVPVGQRVHSGSCRVARKQKALAGEIIPENKPDCDNIAKAVLDALNGIAYKDDSQVADLVVRKRFGEKAHVSVRIESEGGGSYDAV